METATPHEKPVSPEMAALLEKLAESDRRARKAEIAHQLSEMLRLLRIKNGEHLSVAQMEMFEAREAGAGDLDGDGLFVLRVDAGGEVDGAHAAVTDLADDLIRSDAAAEFHAAGFGADNATESGVGGRRRVFEAFDFGAQLGVAGAGGVEEFVAAGAGVSGEIEIDLFGGAPGQKGRTSGIVIWPEQMGVGARLF